MNEHEFTLDRFTRRLLLAITVLLTIIAVELWGGRPSLLPVASAQIPDSGKQRYDMIAEAKKTNKLLGEILSHLRTGSVKVVIAPTDKKPGRRGAPR